MKARTHEPDGVESRTRFGARLIWNPSYRCTLNGLRHGFRLLLLLITLPHIGSSSFNPFPHLPFPWHRDTGVWGRESDEAASQTSLSRKTEAATGDEAEGSS